MYKVKLDGEYLYHPWKEELSMTEGKLTQELNKNGSFDFFIPFTHPLSGSILRRRSVVEVVRFDKQNREETVYRGCCLNDTGNTGFELEVATDGDLVFLQDSIVRPYPSAGENGPGTVDPDGYFRWLVARHNAQVDNFKTFTVGTVNVTGETKLRTRDGYNTTREAVDELIAEYGGYVRTRTEGNIHYIDYIAAYDTTSEQDIRQGKNVIDITRYIKTDDLATRIIPIGTAENPATTIKDKNNGLDYVQDDAAIAEFGIITKVVEFPDISTPSRLLAAGREYLETVKGAVMSVELTAVDLADIGIEIDRIAVGDAVPCAASAYGINTVMQVTKKVTDLLKPENSKVTLGASVLTYTQKQRNENSRVIPLVRNVQKQVKVLQQEMPSYGAITNLQIDAICK